MCELGAGADFEGRTGSGGNASQPAGRRRELAGICLRQRDEFRNTVRGRLSVRICRREPGRLTRRMAVPSALGRKFANARARRSVEAPGGKPRTIWIGRLGYGSAETRCVGKRSEAASRTAAEIVFA